MSATRNRTTSRVGWTLLSVVALFTLAALGLPAAYLATGIAVAEEATQDKATPAVDRDPSPEFLPKPTLSEERILVALEEPADVNFTEMSLQRVVDSLAEAHRIEIQLDNRALEDAAIGGDTPITRKVNNVKLKSALELLLRDMDLTYLAKNEVLLITTKDKAETELLTRVYPVGDLVDKPAGETLIKATTSTVRPPAWDEVGGPGSIVYVPAVKGLVVSQTHDVHHEVLELLRALRGTRRAAQ